MRRWEWIPKVPKVDRFHIPKRHIRILNDDERTRLLASCKASHSPSLYAVVFTALTTGGRYKEILRLRWEDVDFNRGLITFWHTKNGRVRSVPMPDITKKVLQERERHGPRLFPQTTLWRAWDIARKRARLSDFRFHDLRHTFASYLALLRSERSRKPSSRHASTTCGFMPALARMIKKPPASRTRCIECKSR